MHRCRSVVGINPHSTIKENISKNVETMYAFVPSFVEIENCVDSSEHEEDKIVENLGNVNNSSDEEDSGEDDGQNIPSGNDIEYAGRLWKYHQQVSSKKKHAAKLVRIPAGLTDKSRNVATLLDVFNLFISDDIIEIIIQYTD